MKKTTNGKLPQNIKCWISQQPLVESTKIKIKEMKWRWSPMEEDLKISKVEYLSNHWSDFPQILNISSGEQTHIKNAWNEDNLKILKVEYFSNH